MLIACKDKYEINKLKHKLNAEFEIKDLGPAKRILGIDIYRDRDKDILTLTQKSYIDKVLSEFELNCNKPVSTPIGAHFKLSVVVSPLSSDESNFMSNVPY